MAVIGETVGGEICGLLKHQLEVMEKMCKFAVAMVIFRNGA